MHVKVVCLLLGICWLNNISAIPKPDDDLPIGETIAHNSPLEHDSSKQKHFVGEEHNLQYDHEAFLGQEEAKEYEHLTPAESRRRLGILITRIDKDEDGYVDLSELKRWIEFVQRRYIDENTARVWAQHEGKLNDSLLSWDQYKQHNYGFLDGIAKEELEYEQDGVSYKKLLTRDRRRWGVADKDLDDNLNRDEFTAFLHPEDNPDMRDVVLTETIEDIDKDKDGKISVDEYIGDMFRPSEADEEEPEWVLNERETFKTYRDTDNDGFMDREEVRAWIVPKDFQHSEAEAKHLLFEADKDNDERLTRDEILDAYDVFVGSQATSFGDDLARHDEF